jgi:hypothetical protein
MGFDEKGGDKYPRKMKQTNELEPIDTNPKILVFQFIQSEEKNEKKLCNSGVERFPGGCILDQCLCRSSSTRD